MAAVLSLIIPGAGQIYKGQLGKGLAFLICTAVGYLILIVPGLALHLFAVVEAFSGAVKTPQTDHARDLALREEYEKKTPEQRRAETRRSLAVLGGIVAFAVVATAILTWFQPTPSRQQQPAKVIESAEMVRHRMVYNALLLGRSPADISKRYEISLEQIEIIRAEGKSRGWILEDATKPSSSSPREEPPISAYTGRDEAADFIARFGHPDVDTSSDREQPRPPITTRVLTYNRARVRAMFRAELPFGSKASPAGRWKSIGYADPTSNTRLSESDAVSRLENRKR